MTSVADGQTDIERQTDRQTEPLLAIGQSKTV